MPLFCSTPAWSFSHCIIEEIEPDQIITRFDFIIGFTKFNGPSSYPRDQGIFTALFWDLLLFLAMINLRRTAWFTGKWKYMRNSNKLQTQPKFIPDTLNQNQLE